MNTCNEEHCLNIAEFKSQNPETECFLCHYHYQKHMESGKSPLEEFQMLSIPLKEVEKKEIENKLKECHFSLPSLIKEEMARIDAINKEFMLKMRKSNLNSALRINYYISCHQKIEKFKCDLNNYVLTNLFENVIAHKIAELKMTQGISRQGLDAVAERLKEGFLHIKELQPSKNIFNYPSYKEEPLEQFRSRSWSIKSNLTRNYSHLEAPKDYRSQSTTSDCQIF